MSACTRTTWTHPSSADVHRLRYAADHNYGFVVRGWRDDRRRADNAAFMRSLALAYSE